MLLGFSDFCDYLRSDGADGVVTFSNMCSNPSPVLAGGGGMAVPEADSVCS